MVCIALVSAGHTDEELSAADQVVHSLRDLSPASIRDTFQQHIP